LRLVLPVIARRIGDRSETVESLRSLLTELEMA